MSARNSDKGSLGSVLMYILLAAGGAIFAWSLMDWLSSDRDGIGKLVLGLVLGGGLMTIAVVSLKGGAKDREQREWLEKNGARIKARPVDIRTITTDSARRTESYRLVLEADEDARRRYNLEGVRFETDELFARSVPENYQNLVIDVVIDPARPGEVYQAEFNTDMLWSAAQQ